jgi:peptidyl-prolyl cis-trans isomerase C
MKISLLKSVSFLAVFTVAATQVQAADPVVANVNGHTFTYSQVMETKEDLPKKYQSEPDDKLYPILLNQVVDTYLIEQAANAAKTGDKPEVKKAIAKATEKIVAQAFLMDKIKDKISDTAVKAKFDEVIKQLPEENEFQVRIISVDTKETADAIIKALKNGEDFQKLAKTKSKDATAKEGGDLGFVRKGQLPKELDDVVSSLKPGTFSQDPIKTEFGWHVIKVDKVQKATPPKFDEVKNEIKGLVTQEAVVAVVKELRTAAKVELKDKEGKGPLKTEEAGSEAGKAAPAAPAEKTAPAPAPEAAPAPAPEAAPAPAEKK